MAKLSRNQRHKARQRRTLSLVKREFRKLYTQHNNTTFALLVALAQAGGKLVLSEAALKETVAKVQQLSWKSAKQEDGSVVIELVDNTPKAEDSVTMRYLDEDEAQPQEDVSADPTPEEIVREIVDGDVVDADLVEYKPALDPDFGPVDAQ